MAFQCECYNWVGNVCSEELARTVDKQGKFIGHDDSSEYLKTDAFRGHGY